MDKMNLMKDTNELNNTNGAYPVNNINGSNGMNVVINNVIYGESYFDGGLLQLIGWSILGFLITVCTLGICYPWACCMKYNWEIKHTVVNGRRLKFTGHAIQLFGNWIKWALLTLITLGIYSFWLAISLRKWKAKHTVFAD